ncbi:MAG: hypothetical protein A2X56_00280 [Nitrospirae bacterium GWC2_57_13]|nr:MAG: hypothetical protein A2X56_00280 [Nitrospirae bacterium GWC2_57_13]
MMKSILNPNGEVSMIMNIMKTINSSGWLARVSRVLIFIAGLVIATDVGAAPTRLYLQNATSGVTTTNQGAWSSVTGAPTLVMSRTKSGAITSRGVAETNATNTYDVMVLKFVSEPIPGQTIAAGSTLNWVIGALESNTAANDYWAVHAYVVSNNGATVRGTLLANSAENTTNEFPTTAQGWGTQGAKTLTAVTALDNDRIVIEVGYIARNAVTTSYTSTLWYGGTGGDLAVAGDETTLTGWFEFSQDFFKTLTVGDGTNPVNAEVIKSAANRAVDGFTMVVDKSTAVVSAITVTGTNTANVSSVKIYADNGVIGAYESGTDTLVGSATFSGATANFTGLSEAVTTTPQNYIVTYDIVAAPTTGQTLTGTVTAVTAAADYFSVDDTSSATLTVVPTGQLYSCSSCHNYPPYDGARSGATGAVVGDHQEHAVACSTCHIAPATTTSADFSHRDGNIVMRSTIAGGSYNRGNSFVQTNNPTTGTCSTNSCHGGGTTLQWGVGNEDCTTCHNAVVASPVAQSLDAAVTQRRAIVPEFKYAWSHKRSTAGGVPANTVVSKYDCIVCHMEGKMDTGNADFAFHGNGNIELRDPDTGSQILGVTFTESNGTWNQTTPHNGAGSYSPTATPLSFVRFSRDLGVRLENDAAWQVVTAIQINQCLKCHDNNGALSTAARVPGGSALQPFAVAITGHVAPFDSNGQGNVVDVNKSFITTNASYHPVRGRGNNSYTQGTRMVAPWNMTKTTGNNTQFGYVVSCWDCHAPNGASGVQTLTVTAHGAAATLRGTIRAAGSTASTNLCLNCHATAYSSTAADNHGTGSAYGTGGGSSMNNNFGNCSICHSYGPSGGTDLATSTARPLRAEDVHGFDDRTAGVPGSVWGNSNSKPYAFFRMHLTGWKPLSGATVPAGTATCGGGAGGSICDDNMTYGGETYTPGGAY